ncbi:transposase [Mesorhizobium opportunistum]|uniref:Transposase n=1 Tax=Mesorhizobium opportunistum TaxID=593909 RepID=A0ABV1YHK4_9HYPH|nr:transposase [Mesorhizobium sp.]
MTSPIYHDAEGARQHLEVIRWPHGPFCPHCCNANPGAHHYACAQVYSPGVVHRRAPAILCHSRNRR